MPEPAPVLSWDQAVAWRQELRGAGSSLVFTNGVFDILHRGHVDYLFRARELGDRLLIGLNDDASVTRLKGEGRPVNGQEARARLLTALRCVDALVIFGEDTPLGLITALSPDVLVKGADYRLAEVVGHQQVIAGGGRVELIPLTPDQSTTRIVQALRRGDKPAGT